jgi:hypothetical protein
MGSSKRQIHTYINDGDDKRTANPGFVLYRGGGIKSARNYVMSYVAQTLFIVADRDASYKFTL